MTKKKYHYYVLVFTDGGPVYVTGLGDGKMAFWDSNEKPYELSESIVEDVCMGLNLNFYTTVMVKMPFELESQPYLYDRFELTWVEKEEENNE